MALYLVKTQQITTTTTFLLAAGVPYYAVYLYIKACVVGLCPGCFSNADAEFIDKLLQSDDEVFRRRDQLVSWPVVQLYRNFLIAVVKIFVVNPMYRTLTLLPIFFVFHIHDRSAKPYRNKSVNVLQSSSTICLSAIVICNVVFSFSLYMTNLHTILYMDTVLMVLSYIESIVYFIFPLMLPASILWMKYVRKTKEE